MIRAALRKVSNGLVLLAFLSVVLVGCNQLPDEVQKAASLTAKKIDAGPEKIGEARRALEAHLASDAYAYLRPYAEREAWSDDFTAATRELDRAKQLYTDGVVPLIDRNSGDDTDRVNSELLRVNKTLDKLGGLVAKPNARATLLVDVKENGPERVESAQAKLVNVQASLVELDRESTRAAQDYPAKRDDLGGRVAALRQKLDEAGQAVTDATAQLREHASGQADLAHLADALTTADTTLASAETGLVDLKDRIDQLYASYAKTLVDMKAEYTVVIGRTSWNEYSDWPSEHEYKYAPRKVTIELMEALDALGDGPVFSGRSPRVSASVWQALALDPVERLPRGDNAVELWVGTVKERFYHRYEYVEGESRRQGEWEEVDDALFERHVDDLGMDIVAKPYGTYEDEALREAMPPGMAFVGNPKYGRWEDDGRGGRRWSWIEGYLFYRLMFGGNHYYHYGAWNSWHGGYRGRSPYYGGASGSTLYGTRGKHTQSSSRYAGSSFARGGGFKRSATSFRGSGPRGRGGGPGGRGK